MTHDLRSLIDLVEAVTRRTMAHKSLDLVTVEDVVRAYVEVDDLRDVLEGHWDQIDWGEDEHGEPLDPQLPQTFEELTDHQVAMVAEYLGPLITYARRALAEASKLDVIPITRRLTKTADLARPLGVHWSYGAEPNPHTAHRGGHILYAQVRNENVDWTTSLARAMFWWEEEREITHVAGSPINILRLDFAPGTQRPA